MKILLTVFSVFLSCAIHAQVKLPYFFSDHMVLQQQTNAKLWGWGTAGKMVKVTTSWSRQSKSTTIDALGKWTLELPTPAAGGPYEITITDGTPTILHDVMVGEVWICGGQSNMEMPLKGFKNQPVLESNEAILASKNNNIRLYTIPRSSKTIVMDTSKASAWKVAEPESVSNFSATAYFFGQQLSQLLNVPIGLIHVSFSGSFVEAWMSKEALQPFEEIKVPAASDTIKMVSRTPTTLYNGMLHPLVGFTIKGAIWYQGESNYERPDLYEQLFPAMVKQWRSEWGIGNFPFYYVQIAPYDYAQLPPYNVGGKYNSAYLRDAQRRSLAKIPNSGMAVTMDIGEQKSIHPMHKQEGGSRLALLALGNTYGLKGFATNSPLYDTFRVEGNIMTVIFKNSFNGLTSFGKDLRLFEVAGSDKVYHAATAVITNNGVAVSSPEVKQPIAVRYAFKDFVIGDLFGTDGLPVGSFKSDNW